MIDLGCDQYLYHISKSISVLLSYYKGDNPSFFASFYQRVVA